MRRGSRWRWLSVPLSVVALMSWSSCAVRIVDSSSGGPRGSGLATSPSPTPSPPLGSDTEALQALTGVALRIDAGEPASVLNAGLNPAADGEAVERWRDLSGNDVHLNYTISYSATPPTYVAQAGNGLPGIRFDGNLNALRATAGSATILSDSSTDGWAIFVVARPEKEMTPGSVDLWGDGGPSMLFSYGGDKDYKRIQVIAKRNGAEFNILGSKWIHPGQEFDPSEESPFVVLALVDEFDPVNSVMKAYVNGSKVGEKGSQSTAIDVLGTAYASIPREGYVTGVSALNSPSAGLYTPLVHHNDNPAGDRGPFTLGSEAKASAAGRSFKGVVSEVIVFKRKLDEAQVLALSNELYKKWVSASGL